MEDRRRSKRLDLDVTVELERLNTDGLTTLKFTHVDVVDLSKTGIGFRSKQKMEAGTYYDVKLQIWTKEIIDSVVEIIRVEEEEDGYRYGAVFVGMTETNALKIEIYQLFNELD